MKKLILILLAVLMLTGCVVQDPTTPAKTNPSQTTAQTEPAAIIIDEPTSQMISEDEAFRIALNHAGLNTGAVKSRSIELDSGEGTYEVEFFTKGIEYEYEINIYTGEIIKAEKDTD